MGLIEKQRTMIFHQRDVELPKEIHCVDSIVSLKLGIKNNFRVPVINNTNHDITIRKNLIIGHLEYVSSIVTLEVTTGTA